MLQNDGLYWFLGNHKQINRRGHIKTSVLSKRQENQRESKIEFHVCQVSYKAKEYIKNLGIQIWSSSISIAGAKVFQKSQLLWFPYSFGPFIFFWNVLWAFQFYINHTEQKNIENNYKYIIASYRNSIGGAKAFQKSGRLWFPYSFGPFIFFPYSLQCVTTLSGD